MKVFTIFLTVVTMAVSSTAMEDLAQSYTPVESHLNKRDTANMTWAHADSSQTSCNETDRMNSWSIANWNTVYIKDCECRYRSIRTVESHTFSWSAWQGYLALGTDTR